MDKINEEAKKNELRQNYENLAVKYYNRFLMSNGLPAATNADMCERLADQPGKCSFVSIGKQSRFQKP